MEDFLDAHLGDVITLFGILVALFYHRRKSEETQQRRHEENLQALARLEHLDRCVDELKDEVHKLKDRIMDWIIDGGMKR